MSRPRKYPEGTELISTNSGKYLIQEYVDTHHVVIRFVLTNTVKTVRVNKAYTGSVKDPYYPSVFGTGYLGVGEFPAYINSKPTSAYLCWSSMLNRCYNPNKPARYKIYDDCSVCKDWLNFQVFAEWFTHNNIKGYDLDKDVLATTKTGKVYSPSTCCFISHKVNAIQANAKNYTFIDPSGISTSVYNLAEFCKEHQLTHSAMSQVSTGKREQHKGWRKYQC